MNARVSAIPHYIWQMANGRRLHHEQMLDEMRQRDIHACGALCGSARILDLANGRLRPQYSLLQARGQEVYGIDLVNRPSHGATDLAYSLARRLFIQQARVTKDQRRRQSLICGNVSKLPFPNCVFDLVTSVAAFEHFLDVPAVASELHRVLRPGGIAWVCIHLFTSPSGGHNVSFVEIPMRSVPMGVEPWDHLRKQHLPFFVPLNKWRRHQYLDTFAQHFTILNHYCAIREGEHLLTPQIEAELSDYSRDELTSGAYVILAQKTM